jgi:hypothetical protein
MDCRAGPAIRPYDPTDGVRSRTVMKFARIVFTVAGVWGIAVLTPLYFLVDS